MRLSGVDLANIEPGLIGVGQIAAISGDSGGPNTIVGRIRRQSDTRDVEGRCCWASSNPNLIPTRTRMTALAAATTHQI